jgi:calcium/proton exchanger cax
LCRYTEEVAGHTNETIGGLLTATFGNVTEMVISFFALAAGELRVVQLSLLGRARFVSGGGATDTCHNNIVFTAYSCI